MAPPNPAKMYPREELVAIRSDSSQDQLENRILNALGKDPTLSELLRARQIISNGVLRNTSAAASAQQMSTESDEPIRQQLDGQDVEWKLRERHASENDVPSPLTAPHEVNSQLNEGFKRFYKAVVSPNNIRVTAGGRIVPNNLGMSSPTGKGKDKVNGETASVGYGNASSDGLPTRGQPLFGSNPVSHNGGGMPAPPFPMPINGFPVPHVGSNPIAPTPLGDIKKGGPNSKQNAPKSVPDQGRAPGAGLQMPGPFMGHPMMQGMGMPMHPHPLSVPVMPFPMPMMPSHPSMAAYPGSSMGQMAPPMGAFNPIFGPMPLQAAHFAHAMPMGAPGMVPAFPHLMGAPQLASAPPSSSIRMSNVTRKHIENLRMQLKWVDDQLQYNKHQVDEKLMTHQGDVIRQQIETFETNLKHQLDEENRQSKALVKYDSTKNLSKESVKEPAVARPVSQNRQSTQSSSIASETRSEAFKKAENLRKKERANRAKPIVPKQRTDHSTTSTTDSIQGGDLLRKTSALVFANGQFLQEPLKKRSGLPRNAALAPPFQPRSHSVQGLAFTRSTESLGLPHIKASEEERGARDQRFLATGSEYTPISSGFGGMPARHSTTAGRQPHSGFAPEADTKPSNQLVPYEPVTSVGCGLGQPYLEGRLPPGIDARKATEHDYIYHRALTDEEIRARHLYWGKAPRSVLRGLPKYDGKDFYPASPVKDKTFVENVYDAHFPALPLGQLEDYAYKPRPSKPAETDPFARETVKDLLALQLSKAQRATQSDNVNGGSPPKKENGRTRPTTSLVSREISDSDNAAANTDETKSRSARSSDTDDSHEIVFNGRRNVPSSGTGRNGIWHTMGKINTVSANALPGAMSSTTAHGLLPQYAGSAAASLTPAMAQSSVSTSSPRISSDKAQAQIEHTSGVPLFDKKGENRPPTGHTVANRGARLP